MKTVTCLCMIVLGLVLSASSAPMDDNKANVQLAQRTIVPATSSIVILPTGVFPTGVFPTGSGYLYPSGTVSPTNSTLPVGGASPTVTQPITESPTSVSSSFNSVPTSNVTITPSVTSSATASPLPTTTPGNNGTAACNSVRDGSLVCNGEEQYGLCTRGRAIFQNVAPGTACITGADGTGTIGRASNSAACSAVADGSLVCNGPDQYGLCNQGSVTFMNVAPGTQCSTEPDGTGIIRSAFDILSKA
ncbi:hypothetical protein KC343_g19534 [Hortaea werneckii]|nr:hypothetical protein KC352_g36968 [Hortaea werneckii]KAI7532209.1 hypothetical protein KC317_g19562 [Hortaea werneckii]KAI7577563.1 hypothetical protein KC346_g19519 [Hortaea werneckii]KAI7585562.1 hypothetical protein KC343_g19534 [Hortaea werneckii]KAI7618002.1 hypothetical protein KC319_g19199 [Hortaea werneckii]